MRYTGLDLPVFEADRKLYTDKKELIKIAELEKGDKFLRRIHFTVLPGLTLAEFLEWGDKELSLLAELTQGEVLGHKWGFYPRKAAPLSGMDLMDANDLLPGEYRLAAEVNVVDHSQPSLFTDEQYGLFEMQQRHMIEGIETYTGRGGRILSDLNGSQFVHGTQRPASSRSLGQFIVADLDLAPNTVY